MNSDNQIVHGMWIGAPLSSMELLTLKSFLYHGHEFHLWVYDEPETAIPPGVKLRDASNILPRESIFRYKHKSRLEISKGSLAGFSDIFRYKLLYDHGGWWADMDASCLKPLISQRPMYFGAMTYSTPLGIS